MVLNNCFSLYGRKTLNYNQLLPLIIRKYLHCARNHLIPLMFQAESTAYVRLLSCLATCLSGLVPGDGAMCIHQLHCLK